MEICEKVLEEFYRFFLTKSVRPIPDPLSAVVSNFSHSMLLRSSALVPYWGTWGLRTLSQVSRFLSAPRAVQAEEL